MSSKNVKVSCLIIVILIQVITICCQNISTPTVSSEDPKPSKPEMPTTPMVEKEAATTTVKPLVTKTTSSETNVPTKESVAITTSHPVTHATVVSNTSSPEHPLTHPTEPTHHHHSEPTHHEETNTTNKTHVEHPGPHSTMGYPHEPPVVDADTQDQEEKLDDGWQISIYVVVSLLVGIVLFVVLMVIKNKHRIRRESLRRERKRSIARERKSSIQALKMRQTEEPQMIPRAEKKKEEKRLSMHSRADPEESIPLLHLHIMDGEPPVLNHIDITDTHPEPEEPTTSQNDYKPLREENGHIQSDPPKMEVHDV